MSSRFIEGDKKESTGILCYCDQEFSLPAGVVLKTQQSSTSPPLGSTVCCLTSHPPVT